MNKFLALWAIAFIWLMPYQFLHADSVIGRILDFDMVEGAEACAECHEDTAKLWASTRHQIQFKETHRSKEARQIAKRMQIKRIKGEDSLCINCHYTMQTAKKRPKAVSGVSCESCHGESKDWLKLHSEFSGKTEETESPEEESVRWAQSEAAGMIRPHDLYALASNCLSCHAIAHEELVNVGKHPTGDRFELVTWLLGEVRHNVWYTEQNNDPTVERKRMLYLGGLAVLMEQSIRALSQSTMPQEKFSQEMTNRIGSVAAKLHQAAQLLPDVALISQIAEAGKADLSDTGKLASMADDMGGLVRQLLAMDGVGLDAIDNLLPNSEEYIGEVGMQ